MNLYYFFAISLSILIIAAKAGIGCGLANLRRIEIRYVGAVYFFLAIGISQFLNLNPLNVESLIFGDYVTITYVVFALISIAMIIAGVQTIKEWNLKRRDISRYSFLPASVPCPLCVIATIFSLYALTAYTNLQNFVIGVTIGFTFFIAIITTSFLLRRFKSPVNHGKVMMTIGSFYLLLTLLIPAYTQSGDMKIAPLSMSIEVEKLILSLIFAAILFFIGFIMKRKKEGEIWSLKRS